MAKPNGGSDQWRWMLALGVVLAAVIFCCPLGLDTPLLDPDEGLHASIAQEMVERGDWLTPRFLGDPFYDKPILYTWLQALSLRLWGMHEAAVRLPGLMFGLLGAVTTGAVGWRMYGRPVGLLGGLFYTTMILPAALAQAATHDVVLVPCVNMALLMLWEADRASSRWTGLTCVAVAGLFLGLACLAKGLLGAALVGVAYGGYLLVAGRLSVARCMRGAGALGVAALVAAVWYVPAEIRFPGYIAWYVVYRHVLGYATSTQVHGEAGWWYYLPVLLGGGLPWLIYLPVSIQDGWWRWRELRSRLSSGLPEWRGSIMLAWSRARRGGRHGATLLLWCWLIGCTLFLSAAHSKLVTYIWPVFPTVAILAAVPWVRLFEGTLSGPARRRLVQTLWLSGFSGVALLPAAMLVAESKYDAGYGWPVWAVAVAAATSGWVLLGFAYVGRFREALSSGMLSLAVQYLVIMTVVVPPVAAATSGRDLAEHFNRVGRVPSQVLVAEERLGSAVFYLEPELRAGLRDGQLASVRVKHWDELPVSRTGTIVVLPERRVARAAEHVDLGGVQFEKAGRYRIYDACELDRQRRIAAAGRGVQRR